MAAVQQGPAGRRASRAPKVLLVVGIVLTVLGWGSFAGALVFVGAELWDDTAGALDIEDDLEGGRAADLPGSIDIELEAGNWVVLGIGTGLTATTRSGDTTSTTRGIFTEPTVAVTRLDGTPVPTRTATYEVLRDTPGGDAVSLTAFSLDEPTDVLVAAEGGDGSVRSIGIVRETDLSDEVLGYAVPTLIAIVGAVVGSIGPVLAVGGGIWMLVQAAGSSGGGRNRGGSYPNRPGGGSPWPGAGGGIHISG